MFKDRANELKMLEKAYKEKKPKLVILYGRRRVGKTALLNEFAKKHKALYLLARQESQKDQLRKLSGEIAAFFHDEALRLSPFANYDSVFAYLANKEIPVIFDEFPYLVQSNRALPSILQEYWDKYFSKKHSFIILCGSSVMMMQSLLGHKSPLYGRRTEQMLLNPLRFADACCFFGKMKNEQKVEYYAMLGGTPAYLLEFDFTRQVFDNIRENILQKNKFLYQDVLFVLQQELKEPRTYYSIIKSIAKGNAKMGGIVNDTGLEKEKVAKYLSVLAELHIIERRVPITEKRAGKSRKGIYVLKDNYFKFWFRFVFENREYIEQNRQDKLISQKIKPQLNAFVGRAYEEIALEWIGGQKGFGEYIFGRWWDKGEEIDIVGIDEEKNRILFGEVKWKNIELGDSLRLLGNLKRKAEGVKWGKKPSKRFVLIAKKIAGRKELERRGCLAFELKDIMG